MVDSYRDAELRQAMELFFFGYREFTSRADRVLAERGLGRVHHRILYFVGRQPGCSVNALLDILQVSKQALNAPLRELQERGLILSTVAEHDRRVRSLRLTEEGAKLEEQLSRIQMAHLQRVFFDAGAEAEAAWRKVMTLVPNR